MLKIIIKELQPHKMKSEYIKGKNIFYNNKVLGTFKSGEGQMELLVDPLLNLTEYEILRSVLTEITEGTEAEIDESGCQLGYLENGDAAYLIRNWDKWKAFLMKAQLQTLEGQNVVLKSSGGVELGSGLLAEYTIDALPFRLTSCILITSFGERKFEDPELIIEPSNKFG